MKQLAIGINYLGKYYEGLYTVLINLGIINVLKFPGRSCSIQEMNDFVSFVNSFNGRVEADNHGFPGMVPSSAKPGNYKSIKWCEVKDLFDLPGGNIFSTHIGDTYHLESDSNVRKITTSENIANFKNLVNETLGIDVRYGLENHQPGGIVLPRENALPAVIREALEYADFAVCDIGHLKISSHVLNTPLLKYFQSLDMCGKTEIVHVSSWEPTFKEHCNCSLEEWQLLINFLPLFPNLKRVISEIAFGDCILKKEFAGSTDYMVLSGSDNFDHPDVTKKQLAMEAILLYITVTTRNIFEVGDAMDFMQAVLAEDVSNLECVIDLLIH